VRVAWVVPCGAELLAVEEGAAAGDGVLTVVGKELAEFSADCRAGVGEELPGQIE
jgi:hypothetical protein